MQFVHIKSSSAAFQTLMLNSGSEPIVQKKVPSWAEAFPAKFVSFMQHHADLKKVIIHLALAIRFAYYDCCGGGVGMLGVMALFNL